jgi:hypothetical protein
MPTWTGIALARTAPGQDGMQSRLSTYLHPLAGRPLAWHTLVSLATLRPDQLVLHSRSELLPEAFGQVGMPLVHSVEGSPIEEVAGKSGLLILVDAAAPMIGPVAAELLETGRSAYVTDRAGRIGAARLTPAEAARILENGADLGELPRIVPGLLELPGRPEALTVTNRSALAKAAAAVRDRIVSRLMDGGTTFLIPESVLVDVDVRIGRDSVVYPGVVLEGETSIGEETVIGPGCRIVDSWIGSGVELKGWNFISRTSVRNRAILEPHVRRGFD